MEIRTKAPRLDDLKSTRGTAITPRTLGSGSPSNGAASAQQQVGIDSTRSKGQRKLRGGQVDILV